MASSNSLSSEKRKEKKSKNIFDKVKCNFFLIKLLFDNISKKKSFNIIKYNKKIQKRVNINIYDYIKASKIYSSIEVEIIPVNHKYGKFININAGDEKFYHIYFNKNKNEIKRNFLNENEQVEIIIIIIDYQIKSFDYLFKNCEIIESLYFKKFYRNNINKVNGMFYNCSFLKELNLSNFNTNNIKNMSYMFYNCSSLKELNLSNINTNNVIYMGHMFSGCSSLKALNLSNFNTNHVINMNDMFYNCSSLKELNLSNFNTINVIYMGNMFSSCSSLKDLNISNFYINKITHMYYMFHKCSNQLIIEIKAQYKNIKEEAFY